MDSQRSVLGLTWAFFAVDGSAVNEFKAYSVQANAWLDFSDTLASGPRPRAFASSAAYGDSFFLYGGCLEVHLSSAMHGCCVGLRDIWSGMLRRARRFVRISVARALRPARVRSHCTFVGSAVRHRIFVRTGSDFYLGRPPVHVRRLWYMYLSARSSSAL